MYADWCALDKAGKIERVREACRALVSKGLPITYGELAHEIGITRNIIAGVYSRSAEEIGYPVEGHARMSNKRFGMTRADYERLKLEYRRIRAARKQVKFLRPVMAATTPAIGDIDPPLPARAKPKLRVITNEKRAVEEFIKTHGVRRFMPGDSGDIDSITVFLRQRGYQLSGTPWGKKFHISRGRGRPRVVPWWKVIELVDELRAAEGREPILRQIGAEAVA